MSLYSDPSFDIVEPGSMEPFDCSPELEEDDVGIALSAPDTVFFTPGSPFELDEVFTRVIVCTSYQLPAGTIEPDDNFVESVIYVAVNAETNQSYTGFMGEAAQTDEKPENSEGEPPPVREAPPLPPDTIDMETLKTGETPREELLRGGWINPNLADILGLPSQEATYYVFAYLKEYKSNTVKIRVEARKP
ncbi:MAG: hypothetical protein HKN21_17475 [Candidatus Eisenbacteria bacterium]|uniref:Uncharacterized protein n=1 Tax=Eiseniibacteriota bacterium TaxID=2212470 RepID=A0A7Y2H3Z5_UNCEI|nr:hypothetical protein [Candidatus Eisenbacteria bacterium]